MHNVTRRSIVLAGLGALALMPVAAFAETVHKVGYHDSGDAWLGFVEADGKKTLYEGGVPVAAEGEVEVAGEWYWICGDGGVFTGWRHMDDDRWVYYSPEKGGAMLHGEACVPENNEEGAERKWYYFDKANGACWHGWCHLDDGRWVYYDAAAGWMHYGESYLPENNEAGAEKKWYYLDEHTGACYYGWRDMEDGRRVYYDPVGGWMHHGWFEVDGKKYYADKNTGNVMPAIAECSASGQPSWDFTDWEFVESMKAFADQHGSETDWFIAATVTAPVRAVIFKKVDGQWIAAGGWYCSTGRKYYSNDLPRETGGLWHIEKKWLPGTSGSEGYTLDFIPVYGDDGSDNSAAWHAGLGLGQWGYNTHSCFETTYERTEWMYNNIPLNTPFYIDGECGGIHGGDLQPNELHDAEIDDPFA